MKSTTTTKKVKFDKELFKRSVLYNVTTLYRKTLEEATPQQIFQAVSYAIKDQIIMSWMETQKAYEKEDPKMVYYMSMEFLMGRAMGNNLINMQAYKPVQEACKELGLDLNVIEDQDPDPVEEPLKLKRGCDILRRGGAGAAGVVVAEED